MKVQNKWSRRKRQIKPLFHAVNKNKADNTHSLCAQLQVISFRD